MTLFLLVLPSSQSNDKWHAALPSLESSLKELPDLRYSNGKSQAALSYKQWQYKAELTGMSKAVGQVTSLTLTTLLYTELKLT